jgi:hypothetical protein
MSLSLTCFVMNMVVYDSDVFHTTKDCFIYYANDCLWVVYVTTIQRPRCRCRNDAYKKTRKSNADEHKNKKFEKLKKSPYSIAGYSYRIIFMF